MLQVTDFVFFDAVKYKKVGVCDGCGIIFVYKNAA